MVVEFRRIQNASACRCLERSVSEDIAFMGTYDQMMRVADSVLGENNKNVLQVLVTKTEDGHISSFVNDLSENEEIKFLSAQKETLDALLCVWANGQTDLPSIRIRKNLMQINPKNADTIIYLQGEKFRTKLLSDTI